MYKRQINNLPNKLPEFIHVLKTGFDLENDSVKLESNISTLTDVANDLLKN